MNIENNDKEENEEENQDVNQQIINNNQAEEELNIDFESFYKNLDFTVLVPGNEKREIEFIEIINLFLCRFKKKVGYKGFANCVRKETKDMLENLDRNKKRIITLIKRGSLLHSFSSQIKKVNNSNQSTVGMLLIFVILSKFVKK